MQAGWVKLHRCLMDKAIWNCSTCGQKVVLITILMLANHRPNQWIWKGEKIELQAGQFITSVSSLAKKCGKDVSTQCVRGSLEKFEKLGFLTRQTTNRHTLITVENWGTYQIEDETNNKPSNKLTTNSQQTNNKLTTTNKNEKNEKNEKNVKTLSICERLNDEDFDRLDAKYGTQWTSIVDEIESIYRPEDIRNPLLLIDTFAKRRGIG